MTPARFVSCLETLHWSNDQLAMILGCDEGLVEAWGLGLEDVPPKLAAWLEALAVAHKALQPEMPKSLRGKKARRATEH